jgi:hypothetical protein
MPKITNPDVIEVLRNEYFAHHTAMHLARERVVVAGGHSAPLILDPKIKCDDCKDMAPAGEPGSGKQFLEMHHEMIRVFRKLLHDKGVILAPEWDKDSWVHKELPADTPTYSPTLWDLNHFQNLPQEIRGMFSETDPNYLGQVFEGVQTRVHAAAGDAVDKLGIFIERGVEEGKRIDGAGFHNTIHEYLGSREGKAAAGAEMNKLRNSMFNDYFWSLHFWIDAQYCRLLQYLGQPVDTSPLDPRDAMMTKPGGHAMSASAGRP